MGFKLGSSPVAVCCANHFTLSHSLNADFYITSPFTAFTCIKNVCAVQDLNQKLGGIRDMGSAISLIAGNANRFIFTITWNFNGCP